MSATRCAGRVRVSVKPLRATTPTVAVEQGQSKNKTVKKCKESRISPKMGMRPQIGCGQRGHRSRTSGAEEAAEKVVAMERNSRFLGAKAPRNDKIKGLHGAPEGAPLRSEERRVG